MRDLIYRNCYLNKYEYVYVSHNYVHLRNFFLFPETISRYFGTINN